MCHIPLTTNAEYRIGVHVGCVAESNERFKRVNIKRPAYGTNGVNHAGSNGAEQRRDTD